MSREGANKGALHCAALASACHCGVCCLDNMARLAACEGVRTSRWQRDRGMGARMPRPSAVLGALRRDAPASGRLLLILLCLCMGSQMPCKVCGCA